MQQMRPFEGTLFSRKGEVLAIICADMLTPLRLGVLLIPRQFAMTTQSKKPQSNH